MFIPANYFFNPQAIPLFLVTFFMLCAGIFVFSKNMSSKTNISFLLICISVSIWLLATAMGYLSKDKIIAGMWFRCDNFSVMFISINVYFFILSFLGLTRKNKSVIIGYIIAFILGIIALTTDLLVRDVKRYFWGYFPLWGILSIPVLTLFFGYMAAGFLKLLYHYKKTDSLSRRNQIKYIFIAFLGAYTGSVDYLPTFGIEVYPFGYISIAIFLTIVAHTILRYRLLDINIVLSRVGVFAFVYMIVLGIPFGLGGIFKGYLSKITSNWWLLPMFLLAILASLGPFIYMRLRKKVESRLRAEEFKSHEALRRLSHNMLRFTNLDTLLKLIIHYLVKILKLKFSAIYLFDDKNDNYILKSFWQLGQYTSLPTEFSKDSTIVTHFNLTHLPVVTEELKLSVSNITFSNLKILLNLLLKLKINTIIPCFLRGKLLAFLVLSDTLTNSALSQEDINLLMVLSNEAALAIENAQFYQKEKLMLIEKSRRDALADMAPGAGHQFNNRLVAISSSVELLLLKLEDIKFDNLSNDADKAIIDDAKVMLESIDKEVYKGKEITSAILKQAKAKVDFQELDIQGLIENTYKLILISRSKGGTQNFQEPKFKLTILNEIPKIFASEALLQDSFYNLLDNSFDALQEKSRLISNGELPSNKDLAFQAEIDITLKQENETLIIELKDNGIGIKKENQKRLFVPYFTTKATSAKGTGLGLYIIREFIEKHQGAITCDSEYGEGVTFTIKLPLNKKNTVKK